MLGNYKTRRIRKTLKDFFASKNINDFDNTFIEGCLRFQKEHPQLTGMQWSRIQKLKEKYS